MTQWVGGWVGVQRSEFDSRFHGKRCRNRKRGAARQMRRGAPAGGRQTDSRPPNLLLPLLYAVRTY